MECDDKVQDRILEGILMQEESLFFCSLVRYLITKAYW